MADPNRRIDPQADPHPGRRGRSGLGGLVITLIIAATALVLFLVYDAGFRNPPDSAVAPEGEAATTEAPSEQEPAAPGVPDLAPQAAPTETGPPADAN
jgi:hypothetical protein